jgi:excisionase family DNA binding protein
MQDLREADGMSALAKALLEDLAPDDLAALAERLRPFLEPTSSERPGGDGWLTTKDAAAYLGVSVNSLHKATAERRIPFAQDAPNARCFFKRSDLDEWRAHRVAP